MSKKLKYIGVCKYCGRKVLNTEDPFIKLLVIEIQCPQCKRILKLREDVLIKPLSKERENKEKLYQQIKKLNQKGITPLT